MGKSPADVVRFVRLTPLEREIVDALVDAYPGSLTRRKIAARAYALDPNGGPLSAENCVSVHLSRLRDRLRSVGWQTIGATQDGIRLAPSDGRHNGKSIVNDRRVTLTA